MKKFLEFIKEGEQTHVINNNGEVLGIIYFHNPWKKNVFEAYGETFYDWQCSEEISLYLKELDG